MSRRSAKVRTKELVYPGVWRPRPTVGRHLRKLQRLQARQANGDFQVGALHQQLDVELRRLTKEVANAKRTRRAKKQ